MSPLPPDQFVSAAVAAVYSIGFVAHRESNMNFRIDPNSRFHGSRGIYARFESADGKSYMNDFRSISMFLVEDDIQLFNPFVHGGVCLIFDPIPDDEDMPIEFGENWVFENIDSIRVELRPPYRGCTSPGNLKQNSISYARERNKLLYANYSIHFPNFEESIVHYMRQALSHGRIKSVIIDDDGNLFDVPGAFWRTSKAERILQHEHPVIINIDGTQRLGYVFVDLNQLITSWQTSYERHQEITPVAKLISDMTPSPYISLMMECTAHFGLINGRSANNSYVKKEQIENWIKSKWKEELGNYSETLASYMATLIRHPEASKGGNRTIARSSNAISQIERSGP
nr:hypothetical protein [Methylobacterium sp. L1A1]